MLWYVSIWILPLHRHAGPRHFQAEQHPLRYVLTLTLTLQFEKASFWVGKSQEDFFLMIVIHMRSLSLSHTHTHIYIYIYIYVHIHTLQVQAVEFLWETGDIMTAVHYAVACFVTNSLNITEFARGDKRMYITVYGWVCIYLCLYIRM